MKSCIRVSTTFVVIALVCAAVIGIMSAAILQAIHYNDRDLLKMAGLGFAMALAAPIAVFRLWWMESNSKQFDHPAKEPSDASTS